MLVQTGSATRLPRRQAGSGGLEELPRAPSPAATAPRPSSPGPVLPLRRRPGGLAQLPDLLQPRQFGAQALVRRRQLQAGLSVVVPDLECGGVPSVERQRGVLPPVEAGAHQRGAALLVLR